MSYTFAIGDIHGCLGPLERMLTRIEAYSSKGTVIFLGDYVDRGPNSQGVIDRLIAGPPTDWSWITLQGNHEQMMTGAYSGQSPRHWWLDNGGKETELSYGGVVLPEHLHWVEDMPMIYVDDHRIFVHAGINEDKAVSDQEPEDLLWTRYPPGYSGKYGGRHLVHGHSPSSANPQTFINRTNIDGGCVFGGKLVCAVFDDGIAGGPIDYIEVSA